MEVKLFWPPRVVVAPLSVVVHRPNLSGFENVFRNLRTIFEIHFEIMTGVISTMKITVDFHNSRNAQKTPKIHLFVQIYHFLRIFPIHTKTHVKYTT
jgi:hypothetical protein